MRKSLIVYGDCQAESVAKVLRAMPAIAQRFDVRYHHVANQVADAARWTDELRGADVAALQNIRQIESYPIWWIEKSARPRVVRFAPVGFPSLWPFDTAFGGDDDHARRIFANGGGAGLNFFDALHATLRPIGDRSARLRLYSTIQSAGIQIVERFLRRRNPSRIFDYDRMRLQQADAEIGTNIGRYVLANFRKRRLFHTLGHPTIEVCAMIAVELAHKLGLSPQMAELPCDDSDYFQVPVHPTIAASLELEWVRPDTRYRIRDQWLTFAEYQNRYIDAYG